MLKKLFASIIWILWIVSFVPVFAETVSFEITVDPNPIKVSEFADVTIKAIDENWNVDTGVTGLDVWIAVEWFEYTDPDVVIPWGGVAFFEASDQWVKIFSKWLTIKKAWTYTVQVADIYDKTIAWEVQLQVLAENSWPAQGTVTVESPEKWAVLTQDVVTVVWATSFPNTPVVISIDGEKVQEGLSNSKGEYTMVVTWVQPWAHTLEAKTLDLEGQVVAVSWDIPFEYQADASTLLIDVTASPSTVVTVREQVTFRIETAERVTSALIAVGEWATMLPTTNISPWVFEKVLSFDEPGTLPVDVTLQVWTVPTVFEDVEALVVKDEVRKILTLDNTDDVAKSRSELAWTYDGKIDFFKVRYGTNKNNLRLTLTTSKAEWTLIIAEPDTAYYAQVFPVDENWIINWEPSDIITIWPLKEVSPICGNGIVEWEEECDDGNTDSEDGCNVLCVIEEIAPVCGNGIIETWEECDDWNLTNSDWCNALCENQPIQICGNGIVETGELCDDGNLANGDGCSSICVIEIQEQWTCYTDWIALTTKKVNDKFYITWDAVPNSMEYIVYRADQAVWSLSEMRIVSRTTETSFEYPFDPNAEADKRARYAVEAVCKESQEQKQVWDVTQVKVWPEHTIMFIVLLMIIAFGGVRIIKGMRG